MAVSVLARAADFPVSTVSQINTALAAVQPGDTITMSNKVWQNADILFKKNGTAAKPITLRAQTPGGVILGGASRLRISGRWLAVEGLRFQFGAATNSDVILFRENSSLLATNCVLTNCAIVDYSPALPPDESTDYKWISIYGVSNRVENCYFKGKTNAGTTLVVWLPSGQTNLSNHHVIRRNYFGPRPDLGLNGGETIRVGTSDTSMTWSRTLVEENYFYKCNGETEIISSKSGDNTYRNNTVDSCEGALTLRHGNACTVEGNWFLGRGLPLTGGVRIVGEDHQVYNNYFADLMGTGYRSALTFMLGVPNSALNEYFQVKRAEVAFNTFVNCRVSILIGMSHSTLNTILPPLDCVIANNIVWSTSAPLIEQRAAPINMTWEGNIMHGAALGISHPPGITITNANLELAADGLWRPATNSPALGAAAGNYPFVADDMDRQPRPGAKDIGSDQASTDPVARRPLGPADVGPVWMRNMGAIQSVVHAGDSVTLTWDSLPGLTYQVQYSSNSVNWLNVSQTVSNMLTTASPSTDQGFVAGINYTVTLTIARTDTGTLNLSVGVTGGSLSDYGFTTNDTAGILTDFDGFAVLSTQTAGSAYTIDNVTVVHDTIPLPVAMFSADPTVGEAPLTVTFTDNSTGVISDLAWDFGDGGTTNFTAPTSVQHLYATAGVYTVTLIASNPTGASTNTQLNLITVNAATPPSISNVTLSSSDLIMSGTNGTMGGIYHVLSATNLSLAISNWPRIATNTFDGSGNFSFTNSIAPGEAHRFYIIEIP